jgi:hypothetical protein
MAREESGWLGVTTHKHQHHRLQPQGTSPFLGQTTHLQLRRPNGIGTATTTHHHRRRQSETSKQVRFLRVFSSSSSFFFFFFVRFEVLSFLRIFFVAERLIFLWVIFGCCMCDFQFSLLLVFFILSLWIFGKLHGCFFLVFPATCIFCFDFKSNWV